MSHLSGILLCVTALICVICGVSGSPSWFSENLIEATVAPALANRRLSPVILNELKDFVDLIPTATVDEIAAKYFLLDGDFRTALAYVRSAQFMTLLESALDIPEVLLVLDFVHLLVPSAGEGGTPTTANVGMPLAVHAPQSQSERWVVSGADEPSAAEVDEVEFVLFESMRVKKLVSANGDHKDATGWLFYAPERISYGHPHHRHHQQRDLPHSTSQSLKGLTSFVLELLQHLPRNAYVQMIEQKRQRNPDFAEFYAALRSIILPKMVDNAMACRNVKPLVQTLAAHKISAKDFRDIGFKLISWGPRI